MLRLFQRSPATAIQVALWASLYLLMLSLDGTIAGVSAGSGWQLVTRLCGDVCAADLYSGQPWRFLTANFLHYNALHLVINLVGLIQLGRMVEDWYGWRQTLLLCLLMGLLGNLASAGAKLLLLPIIPTNWEAARSIVGQSVYQPSAGGSVIICGLVGLIGVVGGRSRTRFGRFVQGQMVTVLVFTIGLGVALPVIAKDSPVMLDNLGHAGGALVGGLFGLLHKRMLGRAERGRTRLDGIAAAVLIVACLGLQASTYGKARAEITNKIADANRRRVEIRRQLLVQELQAREQAARVMLIVARLYEQAARPIAFSRSQSLLERATARWAYRADVPAHQTLLPLRWQSEIEPTDPPVIDRLAILRGLNFLAGRLTPSTEGSESTTYAKWVHLASKALYRRPTAQEYGQFVGDFRDMMEFLGKDAQTIREQIEKLGPPEDLNAPPPATAESDPIGDGDAEQAQPEL